tara:strand:+ start:585 stop:1229 length:645 start_codon:yes stop_codon:yes gene_type:complete
MNVIIINPQSIHCQTIIILHGMNQDVNDIHRIIDKIKKKKSGIKFIIPVAKKMTINWPTGPQKDCLSWYNYYTRYDNLIKHDIINLNEFEESTIFLTDIINKESKIIKPSLITLIGISQGGTVCINAALRLKFKIKNIKCIDTIFLHSYYKYSECKSQIFQVLQSRNDQIYNPIFQKHCYTLLKSYNNKVVMFYRNCGHSENLDSMAKFIIKNV